MPIEEKSYKTAEKELGALIEKEKKKAVAQYGPNIDFQIGDMGMHPLDPIHGQGYEIPVVDQRDGKKGK